MCNSCSAPRHYDTVLNCSFPTGSFAHLLLWLSCSGIEDCSDSALSVPERWSVEDRALGRLMF